ncbi:MAG: DNA replication/repair protein RecF [Clostridia bacterium]|nr:DNA replication/repair protein RecF [Clostridia bacterium]
MKIKKIELFGYRNYDSTVIEFDDGLNIIEGKNAQGKTNLLEAIYYCAVGKSFRASREKEVIKWNGDIAKIKLTINKEIGNKIIEIIFSKSNKKTIKIDGIPILKIGELFGELNAVFFSPDELKLIKDSPEDRRRFMDVSLSQVYKDYFYSISKYNKILQSRNKCLKTITDVNSLKQMLSVYNIQIASICLKIKKYRQSFLEKLNPYAKLAHNYITSGQEEINLEYSGIIENSEQDILKALSQSEDKDIKMGFTTYGVHKDDIKVTVNGVDVRTFGSQGQQRTVALSMKLAELEIIKQDTKAVPILLLDDVLSELDNTRKLKLLKFCSKAQTFLTCTEFKFDVPCHRINICEGNAKIIKD